MPMRWTDERLDDLASIVHGNDHRLDTVQDMAQTNDHDIKDLKDNRKAHRSDLIAFLAIGAAWAAVIVQGIFLLMNK